MKKIGKGLFVLTLGFLCMGAVSGCDNEETSKVECEECKNYTEIESLEKVYEENVKSAVTIYAYNNNHTNPSVGSGVVYNEVDDYAYILTNAHVLYSKYDSNRTLINREYTDLIEIVHSNYVRVRATFVAYDRDEDVAVLKIAKSNNYKVAKIVNDDTTTSVGETVFSIGTPNGNLFGMTEGVISSKKIETSIDYVSLDENATTFVYNSSATINAGNSGGPLFNKDGEVVAINSMYPRDTSTKIYRDYNYSIPARHFVNVADSIISGGNNSYKRSVLMLDGKGLYEYKVADRIAIGISNVENGIYVTNSDVTGISANSRIITEVEGTPVNSMADLKYLILTKYNKAAGVSLTVVDKSGANKDFVYVPFVKQ